MSLINILQVWLFIARHAEQTWQTLKPSATYFSDRERDTTTWQQIQIAANKAHEFVFITWPTTSARLFDVLYIARLYNII